MIVDKKSPSMEIIRKLAKLRVSEIALEKIERLAAKAGIDENQLLSLYVDTKNNVYRKKFASVPFSERILILPQCLRPRDCPAKLNELGYQCMECGKCDITKIMKQEHLNWNLFLLQLYNYTLMRIIYIEKG